MLSSGSSFKYGKTSVVYNEVIDQICEEIGEGSTLAEI